jgi:hypothetical protein
VSPEWVAKGRHPQPGSPSTENAQPVSQVSCAKWWAPHGHRRHTWHTSMTSETEREQATLKRVTLTKSKERSRSGGEP